MSNDTDERASRRHWPATACSPGCPGWDVFNGSEIQRCDECRRFADDDEAIAHVAGLARIEGERLHLSRPGGEGVGSPGDGVTLYSCEHPDCGPQPVVLPGFNGAQLPGGEVLCARHYTRADVAVGRGSDGP
jgi:hypothetical protein